MAQIDLSALDDVGEQLVEIRHQVMSAEMGNDGWDLRDQLLALIQANRDLLSIARDKIAEAAASK